MASRRLSQEPESSVRVYDTHENLHRRSRQSEQDEHNSDESDLFLRAAREEELAQQNANTNGDSPSRSDSRRVSFLVLRLFVIFSAVPPEVLDLRYERYHTLSFFQFHMEF